MLTVKQIEAAKPKEKPYRLLDGNGLYLYVPVSGKKVWQLRYKIDGKEKILTVGKYPLMTLQEARDKAWTARKDISVGIDPVKAKKASSNNNSFSAIYKEWYEHKKQVWSVGYATELSKMFDDDILPIIGGLEIQDIEPMQLLEVIRRFEDRGAMERANKARRRCGEVYQVLWQSLSSFVLSTPLILINSRSHTDSPGIVPSHPEDALRTLQILLPYLTSNKWFAA